MSPSVIVSIAVAAQVGSAIAQPEEREPVVVHYPNPRAVQYSFTLTNTSDRTITNAQLWAYAPFPLTAHQQRRELHCSHDHETTIDERGNEVLHVVVPELLPGAVEIVVVSALMGMRSEPAPELPTDRVYLLPETYIEIDQPAFQASAPHMEDTDARELARQIFAWTVGHLWKRGYVQSDLGALHALTTGEGDCSENAYLFVALCRLHGVPARVIGGYRSNGGVLRPESYHNWAEFHDGKTWRLADPYARVFDRSASSYVALCIAGARNSPIQPYPRFRGEGDGLKVTMNSP